MELTYLGAIQKSGFDPLLPPVPMRPPGPDPPPCGRPMRSKRNTQRSLETASTMTFRT